MSSGKHILDKNSLCKIYFAHTHSHLRYGLSVWGSMISSSHQNELTKLQQKCVDLIMQNPSASNSNLMKLLNILPLNKMTQLSLCKLGHLMTHKLLPQPLQDILNTNGGKKVHRYPTRNKHAPNIQKHQSTMFNHSFLCQSTNEFIKLSDTQVNL